MVWLGFFEFILVWAPVSNMAPLAYVHAALGVVVFVVAYSNSSNLRKTACPARIKRIAKATVGFTVFEGLLGALLFVSERGMLPDLVTSGASFLHLAAAVAIVTQAASTATAYDMWEEKELS
jgi:hypothetical protein